MKTLKAGQVVKIGGFPLKLLAPVPIECGTDLVKLCGGEFLGYADVDVLAEVDEAVEKGKAIVQGK